MRFIILKDYTSVDEEEATENEIPDELYLAVKEVYSQDMYSIAVNESSYFIIDHEKMRYIQREHLIDIIEWIERFQIIGHIVDSIVKYEKEKILSILVDNKAPQVLFTSDKEYKSIDEIISDIAQVSNSIEVCECSDELPTFLFPPTTLLKAIKFLKLEGKTWLCKNGKISVRVENNDKLLCFSFR